MRHRVGKLLRRILHHETQTSYDRTTVVGRAHGRQFPNRVRGGIDYRGTVDHRLESRVAFEHGAADFDGNPCAEPDLAKLVFECGATGTVAQIFQHQRRSMWGDIEPLGHEPLT